MIYEKIMSVTDCFHFPSLLLLKYDRTLYALRNITISLKCQVN